MATPIIKITGSISGAGTSGIDKVITAGEIVTLTDTEAANVGASYQWSVVSAPVGATVILTGASTPSPTFTAPADTLAGTVLIQCVVNSLDSATARAAVLTSELESRIPVFTERDDWNAGGNTQGWNEAITGHIRTVDTRFSTQGLELLETIIPSDTDHVTFSGLDGDRDTKYQLHMRWGGVALSVTRLAIRPNGLTTNQGAVWITGGGAAPTSANQNLMICAVSEGRKEQYFVADISARTGFGRHCTFRGGTVSTTAAANMSIITGYSFWDEAITNITSLEVYAISTLGLPIFAGIKSSSILSLYRVRT